MGYIYLKSPGIEPHATTRNQNTIHLHVSPENITIPYSSNDTFVSSLNQMPISTNTFNKELEKSFELEYGNDIDEHGYLIGIELTLTSERFINLIRQQAIQIIKVQWRNKEFHMVTFDHMDNVLQPHNYIYKLTDAEDAFVIIHLEKTEFLGYDSSKDKPQLPIALFKALLTARNDIYPLEYLLQPDFVLIESGDEEYISASGLSWKPRPIESDYSPETKELLDQIFGKSEDR